MLFNSFFLIYIWKINLYYFCKIVLIDYISYIEESKIELSLVVIVTVNDFDFNS